MRSLNGVINNAPHKLTFTLKIFPPEFSSRTSKLKVLFKSFESASWFIFSEGCWNRNLGFNTIDSPASSSCMHYVYGQFFTASLAGSILQCRYCLPALHLSLTQRSAFIKVLTFPSPQREIILIVCLWAELLAVNINADTYTISPWFLMKSNGVPFFTLWQLVKNKSIHLTVVMVVLAALKCDQADSLWR